MKSHFIFETAQELDNEGSADKEWTSTAVAAKSLGVSPRTIRSYIKKGLLEDNETTRRWYVSLDSLNALRTRYVGDSSTSSAENGAGGGDIAQTIQNVSIRLLRKRRGRANCAFASNLLSKPNTLYVEHWRASERERSKIGGMPSTPIRMPRVPARSPNGSCENDKRSRNKLSSC